MNPVRKFFSLFLRGKIDADMKEEMRLHLEMQAERNRATGMSDDEARYAAQRQFGNVTNIQEHARERRGWVWLEQSWQDLAYAGRQLRKAPGFTLTVILTLALGIGACTVVFTAIHTTLLHPTDAPEPENIVIIQQTNRHQNSSPMVSVPTFVDLEQQAKSFDALFAQVRMPVMLTGEGEPLQLPALMVSANVFDHWGLPLALGRKFLPAEYVPGAASRVVIITHSLWQRTFGSSPSVLGRTIVLNDTPCTIVGVMSPRFARYGSDLALCLPLALNDRQRSEQRGAQILQISGRLKRGVTLAQAQAELDVIAANLAHQYPDTNKGTTFTARLFLEYLNRSLVPLLAILVGVVGCVLLIACSNVANLLLARATVRQKEISIRAALGASRGRIMRQLLAESVLLSALGGGAGILLAQWGLRFLRVYGPSAGTDLARLAQVDLEPSVIFFTVGFSLLTGLVFGLAPAWLGSGVALSEAMKQGVAKGANGGIRGGLRSVLIVVEISLAVILLTGAGLLVRSFAQLAQNDPGFEPRQVATLSIALNGRNYGTPEKRTRFADELLSHLHALPNVEAAAVTSASPFSVASQLAFTLDGVTLASRGQSTASACFVSPDYFETMQIRLLRGRAFTPQDHASAPRVFVINESLAKQYFPNTDPVGQRLFINLDGQAGARADVGAGEIVGVVADVTQGTPGTETAAQLYRPWAQQNTGWFFVMARTRGEPAAFLAQFKNQVYAVDKEQPVRSARTLADFMSDSLARSRLMLHLLSAFGLIALGIAAVGIYSVAAYTVSQRTQEFGIRMALGASRGNILRLVLGRGLEMVGIGLVIGVVASLGLAQVVESLLYRTSPHDPLTLVVTGALLVGIAIVACLLPARRATQVDPMVALRANN